MSLVVYRTGKHGEHVGSSRKPPREEHRQPQKFSEHLFLTPSVISAKKKN